MSSPLRRAGRLARSLPLASLAAVLLISGGALAQGPAPEAMPDLEARPERPAWMGIRGAPGVHVVEVVPDGPAAKAGLKAGDLITGIDGRPSLENGGLLAYLADKRPGDVVRLEAMRGSEDLQLKLVLGEFPLEIWLERQEGPASPAPAPVPAPAPTPPETPGLPGADLRWLGAEDRPFLGVRLQDLTPGLAAYFELPEGSHGLLVEHVHEGGPAEAAGLKAGDILLTIDGRSLTSMTELAELLRERNVGDAVELTWRRGSAARRASATLAARKKDIWVVRPPEAPAASSRRFELEARRRALQEQLQALERERRAVELALEAIAPRP